MSRIPQPLPLFGKQRESSFPIHTKLPNMAQSPWQFPRLAELRQQRESLRQIFEDRRVETAEEGARRLQAWITQARQLGLKALNAFCQTLENWLPKIANYFINRSSNGPTEGFNHGLRAILWRAFGMTNFRHFRARVLHTFGIPKPQ